MSENNLVFVCGQPRSGTSMMMRVMELGGVPIEYDSKLNREERQLRFRNYHGFYELHQPSFTKCCKCWCLPMAEKIPVGSKIIYIERDIEQVIRSWEAIQKGNNNATHVQKRRERIPMVRQKWHEFLKDKNVLKVTYEDMMTNSESTVQLIGEFIGNNFDVAKAITAVDKSLYTVR